MCPVSDIIGEIIEAVADVAPEVAEGVGGAAAGAGIGEAALGGAGSATAGIDTTGLTSGAINDTSTAAGLLDTSTTEGLSSGLNNLSAALPGAADAAGGAGSLSSSIAPATGDNLLPEQTVLGQTPSSVPAGAGAGGGGSGIPGGVLPAVSGITAGSALSSTPASVAGTNDIAAPGASPDTVQFLSPDDTLPSLQTLSSPGTFGIDAPVGPGDIPQPDVSAPEFNQFDNVNFPGPQDIAGGGSTGDGFGSDIMHWLSNPKNAGTAGLLGLSLKNALSQPKLPGALQTAENNAGQSTAQALSVINSGGTATAEWASQKASIDATIDQQIKQQSEAIQQAAASSGEGNQNSGIVQQQIQQMTANANVQRQQLYQQAQQQNVQAALSELTGGDQVLTQVGATQLQQSEEAQQLAAQTAEMALLLQSGGSMKIPGLTA